MVFDKSAYMKPYLAEYRDAHRDEIRVQKAAYRASHRDEIRACEAAYKASHPDGKRAWFMGNLNILRAAQGCDDCGVHEGMLLHHHMDPSTKLWEVSQMCSHSLEKFIDEIAKCTVLCYSCHKKRHAVLMAA